MPDISETLAERVRRLTQIGARGRLVARGLARGIIWRDGKLPPGSPAFGPQLTDDLLDYGYHILGEAFRLADSGESSDDVRRALSIAAEAIEAAMRKNDKGRSDRGFHLIVAATAFHLSQYGARAFCLLSESIETLNLSTVEKAFFFAIRHSFRSLRSQCVEWLTHPQHSDESWAARLSDANDSFDIEDAELGVLTTLILRGMGLYDASLENGDQRLLQSARMILAQGRQLAQDRGYVPSWWSAELASRLFDDLWEHTLHEVLPMAIEGDGSDGWPLLRRRFISLLANRTTSEIELWPSQVEAARRSVDVTDDLVVALPTSAGKTRIAELCTLRALASGRRVIYVTPLRALSAQIERGLTHTFEPLGYSVTSLYGASGIAAADISTLQSASIVVATPEKLDFAIRQQPSVIDDVGLVVLDEGHMIGLGERELRYEVLVQRLLRRPDANARRLVCLSAVFSLGDAFSDFTAWFRSDVPGNPIVNPWRPTRQRFATLLWNNGSARLNSVVEDEPVFVPSFFSAEAPLGRRKRQFPGDDSEFIIATAKAFLTDGQRVLVYCPQRSSVETIGEEFLKLHKQGYVPSYLPSDVDIARALAIGIEWLGAGHVAVRCLALGVALHHAALPRAFLSEIESLLSRRLLIFTVSSPTLAQGIDLSCSVLILRSIYRGGKVIPPQEYANVVGRAGRAYVDLEGITVFPVFDPQNRRKRLREYAQLQTEALDREMESGIVLLISRMIELLASYAAMSFEEAAEYIVNTTGPWSLSEIPPANDVLVTPVIDPENATQEFSKLVDELDTVILGTVDDVAVDPFEVATALDAGLATSLWARRLRRLAPESSALQRTIIQGRAKWLWEKSDAGQRRAFYAAGLGHAAGAYLDVRLSELLRLLSDAEVALSNGNANVAAEYVTGIADILAAIDPFRASDLPGNWRDIVTLWIMGDELQPLINRQEEIAYIQDGIVYRLVWAVEAIRVHAVAKNVVPADALNGFVALALIYGVPTVAGVRLAQAGLSSRRLIQQSLQALPGTFVDVEGMRIWLRDFIAGVEEGNISIPWQTDGERRLWADFVERWTQDTQGSWTERTRVENVVWDAGLPGAGVHVRLLSSQAAGLTYVFDESFLRVGRLRRFIPEGELGSYSAQVDAGESGVVVTHFANR